MIFGEVSEIRENIVIIQLDALSLQTLNSVIPPKAESPNAYFNKKKGIDATIGDIITADGCHWDSHKKMICFSNITVTDPFGEEDIEIDTPEDHETEIESPKATFSPEPEPDHETSAPAPTPGEPAEQITQQTKWTVPDMTQPSPRTNTTYYNSHVSEIPLPTPQPTSPVDGKRSSTPPTTAVQKKIIRIDHQRNQKIHGYAVMIVSGRPTAGDQDKEHTGILRTDWKPWSVSETTAIWTEKKMIESNREDIKNGVMTKYIAKPGKQQNAQASLMATQLKLISTEILNAGATYDSNPENGADQSTFIAFLHTWGGYWSAGMASEAYLNQKASEGDHLLNVIAKYDSTSSCLMVYAPMPEIQPYSEDNTGGRLHFAPNDDVILQQRRKQLTVKGVVVDITAIDGKEYLAIKFDVNKSLHIRTTGLIESKLPIDIIKKEDASFLRFLVESLRRLPNQLSSPKNKVIHETAKEFFGAVRTTTTLPKQTDIEKDFLYHPAMPDFAPNTRQQQVAKLVLDGKNHVYTVAGPAGTGKTRWAAATTLKMTQEHPGVVILLSGENNNTVDNSFEVVHEIAAGDSKCGLRPLRVYAPSREHGINRCDKQALHYQALNPPFPAEGERDIYASMRTQVATYHTLSQAIDDFDWAQMDELQAKKARAEVNTAKRQMENIHKDLCSQFLLIYDPNIIVSTLTAAADNRLVNIHYDAIFIDEAASAKEMNIALAIPKLKAESPIGKMILIGDRKQLPAVIMTQGESGKFMQRCTHERTQDDEIGTVHSFNVCYRMSPQLLSNPNRQFYNNQLTSAISSTDRVWHQSVFPFPVKDQPILLDWVEGEDSITQGYSRSNEEEANTILAHFKFLINHGVDTTNISILSMYEGQRRLISSKIRELLHETGLKGHPILVMNTDGMQGLENEYILLSLVRSSPKCAGNSLPDVTNWRSYIGFLCDMRRTCVATTRARQGVIIVGDIQTIRVAPQYGDLIRDLNDRGCVRRNFKDTLNKLQDTHFSEWYDAEGICNHVTGKPPAMMQLMPDYKGDQQPPAREIQSTNDVDFNLEFPALPSTSG